MYNYKYCFNCGSILQWTTPEEIRCAICNESWSIDTYVDEIKHLIDAKIRQQAEIDFLYQHLNLDKPT